MEHRSAARGSFGLTRRDVLRAAGAGALLIAGSRASSLPAAARGQAPSPVELAVYPGPGTRTASPYTEITFRGTLVDRLGPIVVVGSRSGRHSGVVVPHSHGHGVSYLPDARFEPGEVVTVRAELPLGDNADGSLNFIVARPSPLTPAPDNPAAERPERSTPPFRTRPDLLPPAIDVTTSASGTGPGYTFIGAKIPGRQNGVMVVDDHGELIWFSPGAVDGEVHHDVRVQEYAGQPVVTWWEGVAASGHGLGHFVICDSAYGTITTIQVGNGYGGGDLHEFLLTPQGTALVIIYNPVRWDLSPVGGPADGTAMDGIVQEIDIETGCVVFEWHSLDHIELDESYALIPTESDDPLDYLHLNSIEVDHDGNLVICARHTFAVYKIDRQSGEITWRLNGKRSDFTMGDGTPFAYQHDARVQPNGELTLFDNASADQEAGDRADSRGIVLALDLETMTATLVREYIHPTGILSVSQGGMQVLPNGNVFIGWGSAPVFSEFDADGNVCFNGRLPRGGTSYRAYRFPWIGHPSEPPDVIAESGIGTSITVYASWNGATEVASWEVLAGPDAAQLEPVGSALRDGFETAIMVETTEPFVAAQALDDAGNVLGISEAVPLK